MQRRAARKSTRINLLSLRRHYTDPHGLYNILRAHDQLYFDEVSQSWLVTGHTAITMILDDRRFISNISPTTNTTNQMASISRQMIFLNGEHHRRVQNVMLRPLSQLVKNMPEKIREFARTAIQAAYRTGEIDAVSEFGSPISLLTIAHVLGIPTDDQALLQQLERWSDTFGDVTSGYFSGETGDIENLEAYFRQLIAYKRKRPADDMLSAFILAEDIFTQEDDVVANCMMVFAAGRITTKKLLGNGLSLMTGQWETLQKERQEKPSFTRQLSEELLRMVTPTRYLIREACEDITLSIPSLNEHLIERGQKVLLFLEAANYDPELFSQPEMFRPDRRPNKHIAFGYGPHQCPGATLARIEIQVALDEILSQAMVSQKPGISPLWNPNPNLGGFLSNPLVLTALRR